MGMFMQVRDRKTYLERRRIGNCKQLLRFEDVNIDLLASEFLPIYEETRGGALSSRKKMEILLRYFVDPGFQGRVANDAGVHRTTVTKTTHYVMNKIVEKANKWIKFPSTLDEMTEASLSWQNRFHLPTVIGALDCSHIEIKKPILHGDEYINRKGYASINAQVTCDAKEKISSVSAEWPGIVHDSRIWRRSIIRNKISFYDGAFCLLGDSGYGLSPWLITPFQQPRNVQDRYFNLTHSQERVIVERIFGQVKKGFPILANCVRVSLENVPKVVISCCVLHNVAKYLNDQFDDDVVHEDIEDDNNEDQNPGGQLETPAKREERELKRRIMSQHNAQRHNLG